MDDDMKSSIGLTRREALTMLGVGGSVFSISCGGFAIECSCLRYADLRKHEDGEKAAEKE